MLEKFYDRWKGEAGGALRLLALAAASAGAAAAVLGFVCAAAFIFVMNRYGPVDACLAGATVFLVVTLILLAAYSVRLRPRAPPLRAVGRSWRRSSNCFNGIVARQLTS